MKNFDLKNVLVKLVTTLLIVNQKKIKIVKVKLYLIHIWNEIFSIKTVLNTKKTENNFFVQVDIVL